MQKIKCECGWEGNKYFMLISMEGNKCPKCEAIIPEDLSGWININERKPSKSGWYKIKTTMGDYEAPYAKNVKGEMVWVMPDETMLTHWREI